MVSVVNELFASCESLKESLRTTQILQNQLDAAALRLVGLIYSNKIYLYIKNIGWRIFM
jgi:hypothetical protein